MKFTPQNFVKFSCLGHRRLLHIKRYNTTPLAVHESVADHSFFVAVYGWMLHEYLKQFGKESNLEEILKRALVHDMEESISGDIIMTFKHKNPEFANMLHELNKGSMDEVLKDLPQDLSKDIKEIWLRSKDETLEGFIIKAADKLSLVTYCIEQLLMGNEYMRPVLHRAIEAIKNFNEPWLNEILHEFLWFLDSKQIE